MIIVPQKNIKIKKIKFYSYPVVLLSIYNMFWAVLFLDIAIWFYQNVYFSILEIPKINRADFVVFDRHKLSKLTFIQKVNCVYCGYVNGVLAFAKAVANQTEIYSCAIKHLKIAEGQEHQREFFEYNNFK